MTTASTSVYRGTSGLARFILDDIYEVFKQNRKPLEDKWIRNREIWRGGVTNLWKTHQGDDADWKSDISVDLAQQKTIAAVALINNMAFKKGRLPFKLEALDNFGSTPEQKDDTDAKISELFDYMDDITMKAEAPTQCRRGFLQAAIYGDNYYKMYVGGYSENAYVPDEFGDFQESVVNKNFLGMERISVWDIFRDLETDDLQNSRGVIHRQFISSYELRSFKGRAFFDDKKIDEALENFSSRDFDITEEFERPQRFNDLQYKNNNIEYLECWVRVPRVLADEYMRSGRKTSYRETNIDEIYNGDEVNVLCGIVNDHIVRFSLIEPGERPFLYQAWDEDVDELGGQGVCDKLERYQNSLTGSLRDFENNKKLSGNVLGGVKRKMIKNMPDELSPGLLFDLTEDCERASDAIQPIVIPDVGDSLLNHMEFLLGMADQTSNLPREATGGSGSSAQSVAEYNQIIARSGKYLLNVIANFDIALESYIEKLYEYVMSDPNLAQFHGNFKVKAVGFESFEARAVKSSSLMQLLTMTAQSPTIAEKTDVQWLITEIAKSLDLDPERAYKSVEQQNEEARLEQERLQSDPAYQMELKKQQAELDKIYAEIELDKLKMRAELEKLSLERMKLEKDPEATVSGGVEGLADGGIVDPSKTTVVAEAGPEFVDGELVTQPTIIPEGVGGQKVISTDETAEMLADAFDLDFDY